MRGHVLAVALTLALGGAPGTAATAGADPETVCATGLPNPTALVGAVPGREHWLRARLRAAGLPIVGGVPEIGALQVAFPTDAVAAEHLPLLRAHPFVRFADPDRTFRLLDTPADPLYEKQWALRAVKAPRAWNVETGLRSPVTVAVLDTGVDFDHPDLRGKVLGGHNVTDPSATPQDDNSHGTHVSGVIAATTNNGVGMSGMSWGARILPIKSMRSDGSGSTCHVVAGIVYAGTQAADVLNMSVGAFGPCSAVTQVAVDFAHARGVVPVAGAGNDGARFNIGMFPANCDRVLAVAATGPDDLRASFSNFGSYIDVAAPGVNILTTSYDPRARRRFYGYTSGTSLSSPVAAGLAALVVSRNPEWSPDQVAARIVATSDDLGKRGWDPSYGFGRINAAKAVS